MTVLHLGTNERGMNKIVFEPSMRPPTPYASKFIHHCSVPCGESFIICKQASLFHAGARGWVKDRTSHRYVDGARRWFTDGGRLGDGSPRKGGAVGECDGPGYLWKGMPNIVCSMAPCVGSCVVPMCPAIVIFLKTVKQIDSQYGVAF
jgi:hypothetical protein